MNKDELIKAYQKECFKVYKGSIGYPDNFTYLHGNLINVQVPIETTVGKFMIVGAYPSAKFYTVNGISDVPLVDNDSPFSNESYFDGSRVRTIPSGKELNEVVLTQIGIKREDCWITDLVKVFLFKQGHVDRYIKLGKSCIKENRTLFRKYAENSVPWLIREIKLAEPKVVILLGAEVTSILFGISEKTAKEKMDGYRHKLPIKIINKEAICLPHPGILMKPSPNNMWPEDFKNNIAINANREISNL